MDEKDLERLMRAYIDLCSDENLSVKTLVLNPEVFPGVWKSTDRSPSPRLPEVVVYGFLWFPPRVRVRPTEDEDLERPRWNGAWVNGKEAWNSDRLMDAREYWAYSVRDKKFYARMSVYVLHLEDGDLLECLWGDEGRVFAWDDAKGLVQRG